MNPFDRGELFISAIERQTYKHTHAEDAMRSKYAWINFMCTPHTDRSFSLSLSVRCVHCNVMNSFRVWFLPFLSFTQPFAVFPFSVWFTQTLSLLRGLYYQSIYCDRVACTFSSMSLQFSSVLLLCPYNSTKWNNEQNNNNNSDDGDAAKQSNNWRAQEREREKSTMPR